MAHIQEDEGARRERLLLMAALVQTGGERGAIPSCMSVLRQAIVWLGLWNDEMKYVDVLHPVIEDWYQTLLAMIRRPNSEALMKGQGNLDAPAFPAFTGCRLTPKGRRFAKRLLAKNPQLTPLPKELSGGQRLLLMAAVVQEGPRHQAQPCMGVLRQALMWGGWWKDEMEKGARLRPIVREWYQMLLEIIQQVPPSEALMEASGDLITPAPPQQTTCRLTKKGRNLAKKLLADHPDLQKSKS